MAFMASVSSYALMLSGRIIIGITEGPQFGAAKPAAEAAPAPGEQKPQDGTTASRLLEAKRKAQRKK